MNQPFQPTEEIVELLQNAVDGDLTQEEHHRLEEMLQADQELQRFFTEFMQLHATLCHQAAGLTVQQDFSAIESSDAVLTTDEDHRQSSLKSSSAPGSFSKRLFLILPWALAAVLLISVSLPYFFPERDRPLGNQVVNQDKVEQQSDVAKGMVARPVSRPPAPVATLAWDENTQWEGETLAVGHSFHEGETMHLKQGQAHVSVGYGAEIVAHAPCLLTFLSADRVKLIEGDVVVDVAEWGKGFTVITDSMDVVDLGTTFSVSASSEATVETSVLKGMVRALPARSRDGEQRSVLLTEGEGLIVDELGNRRTFDHSSQEELSKYGSGALRPYRPVELHNSGIGLSEGDQDPYWRVIAGPEGDFHGPEYAQVCVPYKRYLDNDPTESQWVSIRAWETARPNSVYTFATSFHLEGYDLSTMRLFGRFLADNGVEAVRVNGRLVQVQSWTDNVYGQRFDGPQFRFVNVTEGLVEGKNSIEIDVWNGSMVNRRTGKPDNSPNHMALRVEWYAFGRGSALAKVEDNTLQPPDTPSIPDLKSFLDRAEPHVFREPGRLAEAFDSAFLRRSIDSFGMN